MIDLKNYAYKITSSLDVGILGTVGFIALQRFYDFTIPTHKFLLLTFALVMCDSVTGIFAAIRNKQKIQSAGMRRTFSKIIVYFIAILLSEGMSQTFFPAVPLAFTVSLAITATEFKSNIENVESYAGINIWSFIKDKIKIK